MTKPPPVQHKATICVTGRNVDIHAPPFVPAAQLDAWLAETLRTPGVTLVSKSWADYNPEPTKQQIIQDVATEQNKGWQR